MLNMQYVKGVKNVEAKEVHEHDHLTSLPPAAFSPLLPDSLTSVDF